VTDLPYRIGVVFPASEDPAGLPAFARRVEELGYDSLWLIEDCFLSGGLTAAATALAVTESIGVGVGLLPALGEIVTAIRALLAGETVTADGTHVKLSRVALEQPPRVAPPVLIGTTGPKGLAIAGRHADGILLPEGSGPAFVEWAIGQTSATRALRCVVYSWISIDDDPARARRRLMPAIDHWLDSDLFTYPRRAAGATDPPPPGDPARLALADAISVCGDQEMCADGVRRLVSAGADTVVLMTPGDDLEGQVTRFAQEVRPLLTIA